MNIVSFMAKRYRALSRVFFSVFGLAAIAWGLTTLPPFWEQRPAENIARRIIAGEPYNIAVLQRQIVHMELIENSTICRSTVLWSAAIIRLRVVEQIERNGVEKRPQNAEQIKALDDSVRRSLACSPADPFLWLVLYWAERNLNGIKPDDFEYLRLSYRLGPNEGWIALKRNPIVFADFGRLPPDLAMDAVDEFSKLIKNGLYQEAVEILRGPAWRVRNIILPHLATVPRQNRMIFAKIAYDKGLDIVIPGVTIRDSKPWH